jgi:hypothetical protein
MSLLPQNMEQLTDTGIRQSSPIFQDILESARQTVAVGKFVPNKQLDTFQYEYADDEDIGNSTIADIDGATSRPKNFTGNGEGKMLRESKLTVILLTILITSLFCGSFAVSCYLMSLYKKVDRKVMIIKSMVFSLESQMLVEL